MDEPIDIPGLGKLGPIRVDPNADATKARIVRDAIEHLGMDPALTYDEHKALLRLARVASVTTLVRLGRLLK